MQEVLIPSKQTNQAVSELAILKRDLKEVQKLAYEQQKEIAQLKSQLCHRNIQLCQSQLLLADLGNFTQAVCSRVEMPLQERRSAFEHFALTVSCRRSYDFEVLTTF